MHTCTHEHSALSLHFVLPVLTAFFMFFVSSWPRVLPLSLSVIPPFFPSELPVRPYLTSFAFRLPVRLYPLLSLSELLLRPYRHLCFCQIYLFFSLFSLPLMSPCQGFSLSWSNILYPMRKRGPYNHSCLRLESRTLIPFVYLFIYSSHFLVFCFCVFIWFLGILLLFLPVASYASACPLHTHHGPVRPHTSSAFYMPHYLAVCLLVRHLLACPNTCLSLIS